MKYKRVIIKISGEGLANKSKSLAIDYDLVRKFALQIKKLLNQKVEVGIVIGGGNF
jgi:uridylate kinase